MRFKVLLCSFAVILSVATTSPTRADLNADLNRFWNQLGGTSTVTGPTAFSGQAASYYTFGNVRTRSPSRTTSFSNFSLPSVEAGCGGIDIHSGALSMISADELVQTGKAILSNAVGFAFDLALETLSPVLAESMKNLRDLQHRLNQFNINSCQEAVGIVGAVWPRTTLARDKICANLGTSQGVFTDYASARHGCSSTSGQTSIAEEDTPEALPDPVNIAWHVLTADSSSTRFPGGDTKLSELVMTMTGTVIINGADIKPVRGSGGNDEVIDLVLSGNKSSSLQLLDCGADKDKCLAPVFKPATNLTPAQSFRGRVGALIDSLRTRISSEVSGASPPTNEEKALVNSTNLPLYRILNVYAAYSGPVVDAESETLKDIVATDLALNYVRDLIEQTLIHAGISKHSGHPVIETWVRALRDLQVQIHARQQIQQQHTTKAYALVERVQFIERQLASSHGGILAVNHSRTGE